MFCLFNLLAGGMTSGQKSMLISASLFLAFHIDYSSQFLGNLAAQKKWTEFEKMAKAGANGVAAIGEGHNIEDLGLSSSPTAGQAAPIFCISCCLASRTVVPPKGIVACAHCISQ